jgi:hypothetical protein
MYPQLQIAQPQQQPPPQQQQPPQKRRRQQQQQQQINPMSLSPFSNGHCPIINQGLRPVGHFLKVEEDVDRMPGPHQCPEMLDLAARLSSTQAELSSTQAELNAQKDQVLLQKDQVLWYQQTTSSLQDRVNGLMTQLLQSRQHPPLATALPVDLNPRPR